MHSDLRQRHPRQRRPSRASDPIVKIQPIDIASGGKNPRPLPFLWRVLPGVGRGKNSASGCAGSVRARLPGAADTLAVSFSVAGLATTADHRVRYGNSSV